MWSLFGGCLLHAATHDNASCHMYRWVMGVYICYICGLSLEDLSCMCLHMTMNQSHVWMSHGCMYILSLSVSTHDDESCHMYEWVMGVYIYCLSLCLHMTMNHVTCMNESWVYIYIVLSLEGLSYTWQWVMSHRWMSDGCIYMWSLSGGSLCVSLHMAMSHGTYMNELCHAYEWVMWHVWMGHFTRMNESCHTYEWVMSHVWMSHVTRMNESCHTYE